MFLMMSLLLICCSMNNEMKAQTPANQGKTLVVYYSYTGDCRNIVAELTKQTEADVVEITPVDKSQKYEANGYAIGTQLLNAIKANPNSADSYPAIDPVNVELSAYDNIIIVTPLWWSQMAAIMQTYLFNSAQEMAGKNVALIVSSHSSGISGVVSDAKRLLPNVTWAGDALWIHQSNRSQTSSLIANWLKTLDFSTPETTMTMYITIGGQTLTATLNDNSSARALYAALQQSPITYEAHDYGNFEKVGDLGQSFPQNNEYITTEPGDLILYQGDNLCIYYDTNSWNFTRIGRIDNATQAAVKEFVKAGGGNVTITLSVGETTAINHITETDGEDAYYSLSGQRMENPTHGIYIKNGKKILL